MKTIGIIACVFLLCIIAARLKRIDCALSPTTCELQHKDAPNG